MKKKVVFGAILLVVIGLIVYTLLNPDRKSVV